MKFNLQKGIVTPIIVALIALLVAGGGAFYYSGKEKKEKKVEKEMMDDGHAMSDEHMKEHGMDHGDESDPEHMKKEMVEGESMMKKEDVMMGGGKAMSFSHTGKLLAGSASPLLDFNKADYDRALTSGKPILLYFYASWCPLCKTETANALYLAFNDLKDEKVIGFRVNYKDSDTDKDEGAIAKQFGVGYQHTKVILKNGKQVLKSPESWDKARYLKEIQEVSSEN